MFSNRVIESPDTKGMNLARASDLNLDQHVPTTNTKDLKCSCICKCFGYFRYDEWPNLDTDEDSRI